MSNRTSLIGAVSMAFLAACASAPVAADGPPTEADLQTPPTPSAKLVAVAPEECAIYRANSVRMNVTPLIVRQGAELTINASDIAAPGGPQAVPPACFTGWSATPASAVEWSSDHVRLRIKADAPAGTNLVISANLPSGAVTHAMKIVGRDEVVLTGYWRQEAVSCPNDAKPNEPLRELHFDDQGGYSVTFTPFETYKDYWGKAAFDAKAGTLSFAIEDGNFEPANAILQGQARIETDGRLVLNGFFFGDSFPHFAGENRKPIDGPCQYVFVRT